MDKIIIAMYINCDGLDNKQTNEHLNNMEKVLPEDDFLIHYIMPVHKQDTRIECLYPKPHVNENYENIKLLLENIKNLLETLNKE